MKKPTSGERDARHNSMPAGCSTDADARIRLATLEDIPALLELEAHWRNQYLESTEQELAERLKNHPDGQFLVHARNGVLAVMYTQRVASYEVLLNTNRDTELELHVPDGPVLQLLAVLQRPESVSIGSWLRDHVLREARLDASIQCVCGITRCRAYDAATGLTYQDYVHGATDPGLLFHTSAGARIGELVLEYRPRDTANLGFGVLVCYDLRSDIVCAARSDAAERSRVPTSIQSTSPSGCEALVCDAISQMRVVCYRGRGFEASSMSLVGFLDLGIDSLDAVTLVEKLNAQLGPNLQLNRTGKAQTRRGSSSAQMLSPNAQRKCSAQMLHSCSNKSTLASSRASLSQWCLTIRTSSDLQHSSTSASPARSPPVLLSFTECRRINR